MWKLNDITAYPYTGQKVYTAVRPAEKLAQRQYFFWYDRTYRSDIIRSLNRMHRPDLIKALFAGSQSNRHPHK